MTIFKNAAAGLALAAVATIALTSGAEAKKCVLAGGEGNGVTKDIAAFMANAALGNSIKGAGLTAAGKVNLACNAQPLFTSCKATQRACK